MFIVRLKVIWVTNHMKQLEKIFFKILDFLKVFWTLLEDMCLQKDI